MNNDSAPLSVGLSPTDRARGEIWIDTDNGNYYFWWIRPTGERAPEPMFSSIVTMPAGEPVNCAVFPIDKTGARASRAMLMRVRQRLGIAPHPELELTMRLYRENLERMLSVENEPKITKALRKAVKVARRNEVKSRPTVSQAVSQTASQAVSRPTDAPKKQERPKTRGEIVQEYADKVLRGEV